MSGLLRVGLIGYGVGGAVFHAPLIAANPNMRLDAVVTANPERQEQVRADHPNARVLNQAHELFDRSHELDLIVVASPNSSHFELTAAALEAGVPVVVDKPLTPTAAEGRRLIDYAADKGLMLTVFHNRRWDNDLLTVRRLLLSGDLGQVHRFESRFERWVPTPKATWRDQGPARDAGGVLYDLGSHIVDQALLLFGPVARVYAEVDWRRAGARIDDDVFLALTHVNGVRSHLWASKLVARPTLRFRVLGDQAAYSKYDFDPQETDLRAGHTPDTVNWGVEPPDRWGTIGVGDSVQTVPSEPGRYPDFYAEVVRSVRTGSPPPVNPRDAVTGLEIIEAARRCAASGEVERLT